MLIVLALGNNVNGVIVVPKGDDLNSSKRAWYLLNRSCIAL